VIWEKTDRLSPAGASSIGISAKAREKLREQANGEVDFTIAGTAGATDWHGRAKLVLGTAVRGRGMVILTKSGIWP